MFIIKKISNQRKKPYNKMNNTNFKEGTPSDRDQIGKKALGKEAD